MEGNGIKRSTLQDSSSSYSSYSSESEEERAQFIKAAKQFINNKIEKEIQENGNKIEAADSDDKEEDYNFQDKAFYYQGKKYDNLPTWMHGIDNFASVIKQNSGMIINSLTPTDKERLYQMLPQQAKDKDRLLGQILRGDKVGAYNQNPIEQFGLKLQNNAFAKAFDQYQSYQKQLAVINRMQTIKRDIKYIEDLQRNERFREDNQINSVLNYLVQSVEHQADEYLSSNEDGSSEDLSEEEKQIYNEMHAEYDELTSGYTTISSNKGEYVSIKKSQNNNLIPSGTSQLNRLALLQNSFSIGQRQDQQSMLRQGQQSDDQSISTKQDANKASTKKGSLISLNTKDPKESGSGKQKKTQPMIQQLEYAQPFSDPKLLEQIMNSERFKNLKVHKNQVTLPKITAQWIVIYRQQEEERYKHPTRPWVYYNEDGTTSIVGPVIKKKTQQTNQKPRDHPQLHSNRPAIVTLLCLARDAASRLPDGIGTRADILELIKQSQWLKIEGTDPNNLNNIVSGALDRLHYEDDPCVKYDSERKLWIYLHKNRTLDWADWLPSLGERPNTLENNSLNPLAGTENEDYWKNTPHRERSQQQGIRPYFEENENSESIESNEANKNKLIVKIRFDKESDSKPHKRSFQNRGTTEFEDFNESKNKRQKY